MATLTESFNQADSTTLGPDQTWTEIDSDLETLSNVVAPSAAGTTTGAARCEADLDTDDHEVSVDITTFETAGSFFRSVGPIARFASAAYTGYRVALGHSGTIDRSLTLHKIVGGAFTTLATAANPMTLSLPDLLTVDADGSTIKALFNSVEELSVTDTEITGNTRPGFVCRVGTDGQTTSVRLDNFSATDLAAAAPFPPWRRRQPTQTSM